MAVYLFNGVFNTLIMGAPAYMWAILLLIFVLLISWVYWEFMFWRPLKPLHGLYISSRSGSDAALLSDLDLNLNLVSERRAKLIFDETIEEAKKGETDWRGITSGQIGIVGTDIIIDIGKWTKKDSAEHYLIEEAADNWNIDHPDDQIHSFGKFMKYCEDGKVFIDTPTLMAVNWIRIETAFPKRRNTAGYAGYIRQLAAKMDKDEKAKMDKVAMYMIVGSIIISVIFAISKFIIHKPA